MSAYSETIKKLLPHLIKAGIFVLPATFGGSLILGPNGASIGAVAGSALALSWEAIWQFFTSPTGCMISIVVRTIVPILKYVFDRWEDIFNAFQQVVAMIKRLFEKNQSRLQMY